MTVHVWKPNASGYLLNPADFVDGKPFKAGDVLIVHDGSPSAAGVNGQGTLEAGTFDFAVTGAQVAFATENLSFSQHDVTNVSGSGPLSWEDYGNTVNLGFLNIGGASTIGEARISLDGQSPTTPASFTNAGILTVQNDSTLEVDPNLSGIFLNQGRLIVSSGSSFFTNGYSEASSDDGAFRNNDLVSVVGAANRSTGFAVSGSYAGSGTVEVNGGSNRNAGETSANFADPVSGLRLYLTNASALFNYTVQLSTIYFENGDASITVDQLLNQSTVNVAAPFGAVLAGFQTGDAIYLADAANSLTWDQAHHALTLSYVSPYSHQRSESGTFVLAGNYTISDFHLQNASTAGYVEVTIRTPAATHTAQASVAGPAVSDSSATMAADAGLLRITPENVQAEGKLDFAAGLATAEIGSQVTAFTDSVSHFRAGDTVELQGYAAGNSLHAAFASHGSSVELTVAEAGRHVNLSFAGVNSVKDLSLHEGASGLLITTSQHAHAVG